MYKPHQLLLPASIVLAGTIIGGFDYASRQQPDQEIAVQEASRNDTIDPQSSQSSESSPPERTPVNLNDNAVIIPFANEEYGPRLAKLYADDITKLLTYTYPKRGETADDADEKIVIDLYINDTWVGTDHADPESIARYLYDVSVSEEAGVETVFKAPDPVGTGPAFFFALYKIYPDEKYARVSLIKVAALEPDKGSYSVAFTKRIYGEPETLRNDARLWLIDNAETYSPRALVPSIQHQSAPDDFWKEGQAPQLHAETVTPSLRRAPV